ncbi:single-stranded DNA-binding protein [Lishizhenia sp.]|uniref:single-stranded DNA-binding protein n=1 Tax=Lishizhenia sp. TaxID=2497594 RepID=UPI00299E3087|nr:single-stranded DNA-binding protein [Lishizhenia sp.]MDX1445266.1 single-stranded DNA-binding protein [Lishizhenia sp.]
MELQNINHVNLIGQISNEPRFSEENGRIKATFSLRTNEPYLDEEGKTLRMSNWHNIVATGRLARLIQELGYKSRPLGVQGRMVSRFYKNKKGIRQAIIAVEASDLTII